MTTQNNFISASVVLRNDRDKVSKAALAVTSLSLPNRLKIATKSLILSWGAGILCALIPVLHFVLVPMGFMIGIILFYRQLGMHEFLISGTFSCPGCSHQIQLKQGAFNWPKLERCEQCGNQILIQNNDPQG